MSINEQSINNLRGLQRNLAVFSPDTINMIKQTLPNTRFHSKIINVLIEARDNLLTRPVASKFNAIKSDLVVYVGSKIGSISAGEEGGDPWIILKDHIARANRMSPEEVSDHIQDSLEAGYLVATHEFSQGSAYVGDEILELSQELTSTYLPLINELADNEKKEQLLQGLKSLSGLLESMGTLLKENKYHEMLDIHKRVQQVLQNCSQRAKEWDNSGLKR